MLAIFRSGCRARAQPHPACALCLLMTTALQTAKELANAVIPNEYGIDPAGKLRIGSKICSNLMGKILADLANMREESLATAHIEAREACGIADWHHGGRLAWL